MAGIVVTETHKKWARRAGYPLFALIAFFYAMHLTFPYGRIEQRLQEWAGDGFEVTVGAAGPGWFPGDVVLEDVSFKTRPTREGEKPVEFVIDRLEVDLGVMAALRQVGDVEFEALVGDGKIEGEVKVSKAEARIEINASSLPLGDIPGIQTATGGVPMAGGLNASFAVKLPKGKWREAEGEISLDCEGCTIGDGKAKIRPQAPGQQNAFSEGGFTLPRLKLGKLGGKIVISKGLGRFEGFEGKSPDGELYIEGDIRFEDPVMRSQVTAYMRFKSSDELKTREPVMADIENLMKVGALRPDGYMGVKVTGPLSAMRFLGSKISPVPTKDKGGAAAGGLGRGRDGVGAARPPPQVTMPPRVETQPPPPPPDIPQPEMHTPPPVEPPTPQPQEPPPQEPPPPPPPEATAPPAPSPDGDQPAPVAPADQPPVEMRAIPQRTDDVGAQ